MILLNQRTAYKLSGFKMTAFKWIFLKSWHLDTMKIFPQIHLKLLISIYQNLWEQHQWQYWSSEKQFPMVFLVRHTVWQKHLPSPWMPHILAPVWGKTSSYGLSSLTIFSRSEDSRDNRGDLRVQKSWALLIRTPISLTYNNSVNIITICFVPKPAKGRKSSNL